MNTTTTQNRTSSRGKQAVMKTQPLSLDSLRQRLEDHVKAHPLKAIGQAMAAGYVLRFLPIKAILSTGLRLAAPLALLSRIWESSSATEDTDAS